MVRSETAGEGLSQAVGVTAFWPVPSITVLGWWTKSAGTLCTLMSAPDKDSVCFYYLHRWGVGFPGGVSDKERACDAGSVPGLGRSPGGRHGNPLQYSCLENPMDRGAWWATVHEVTKRSAKTEQSSRILGNLSSFFFICWFVFSRTFEN